MQHSLLEIMISILFSILLLLTITVSTTFVFVSWEESGHVNSVIENERARVMVFNDTLLALAATDLSYERTDSEVTEILTGKFHRLRMEYWLWCIGPGVRLKSTEFDMFMVNVRKDLVNWSDRRRLDANGQIKNIIPLFLNSAKHRHYASCAVVGNSGILLQSKYGELIDSHQAVIRLNNAKVNGFENHVGSKTNISLINSNIFKQCVWNGSCNCSPYASNTTLITYISQPMHLLDIALCNRTFTRPTLLVTDPTFDAQCARIVKYYSLKRWVQKEGKTADEWPSGHEGMLFHYSSGIQAVMLALRLCDKVSLFGFGKGNSNSTKHHYHTQQKSELRLHDYDAEYDLYGDLMRNPERVPFLAEFKVPPLAWYKKEVKNE